MLKISACVIVKNEEKNLPRWIEGVRGVADEMIVVDTGSTDATVALAEEAGAEVYHFEWINDFSAAKNYALGKATGDWVIFCDADEFLDEPSKKKLRPLLERLHGDRRILGIEHPLVNIDEDCNNEPISTVRHVRIFRRMRTLCYGGSIHEGLVYSGKRKGIFYPADLVVYHTGYSSGRFALKNLRNLDMLLAEQAERGDDPRYWGYLSVNFANMRIFDKAEFYVKKAIEAMRPIHHEGLINQYLTWISIATSTEKSEEEIDDILEQGLRDVPNHPDLLASKLVRVMDKERYDEAEEIAHQIIAAASDKNLVRAYNTGVEAHLPLVYNVLGTLCVMKGDKEGAEKYLKTAIETYRYRKNILVSLLDLWKTRPQEEVLAYLDTVYDRVRDESFLRDVFRERPLDILYLAYVQPAPESFEAKMASGDPVGAAYVVGRELQTMLASPGRDNARAGMLMRSLALALFSMPTEQFMACEELICLLPQSVCRILFRFHGDEEPLASETRETYHLLQRTMERAGDPGVRDRFRALAADFS